MEIKAVDGVPVTVLESSHTVGQGAKWVAIPVLLERSALEQYRDFLKGKHPDGVEVTEQMVSHFLV